jgi:hypothetical protein
MTPLDLTTSRPRKARDAVAGIVFLPRSIDKARATLPGGRLGDYTIPGFTETMLKNCGITVDDFVAAVRDAATDDDVAAWVRSHATPGGVDAWIDFANNREIYNGDRAEAIADYPYLADHPELVYSLDFLDYQEAHGLD